MYEVVCILIFYVLCEIKNFNFFISSSYNLYDFFDINDKTYGGKHIWSMYDMYK